MLTRFAPTPSGYLHEGNLVNLALVRDVAQALGGRVFLRIDDADTDRLRQEYVEDVFRVLAWLGVQPDVGPRSPADLPQWSQSVRQERYWDALTYMERTGAPVFVCTCSRTVLVDGSCRAGCAAALPAYVQGASAVRLHTESGDVTLWGRFHSGYHLASCVDDLDYGVTHVVRGADLADSSAVHARVHRYLGAAVPHYAHHELVTGPHGAKLSKSQGTARLALNDQLAAHIASVSKQMLPGLLAQFTDARSAG